MSQRTRMSSVVSVYVIPILSVILVGGCSKAPTVTSDDSQPDAAGKPEAPPTFEDRIRSIIAEVDPDLIYERVELPREQNAFHPWLDAAEMLTPMEGAEQRKLRLQKYHERVGAGWKELYGVELRVDPAHLKYACTNPRDESFHMEWSELEEAAHEVAYGKKPATDAEARLVREWLRENDASLELFDDGTKRRKMQWPAPTWPMDSYPAGCVSYMMRARSMRAVLYARDDRYLHAAMDICQMLKAGRLATEGSGEMTDTMKVIAATLDLGHKRARWLAGRGRVSDHALSVLLTSLGPLDELTANFGEDLRVNMTLWWPMVLEKGTKRVEPDAAQRESWFAVVENWGDGLSEADGERLLDALVAAQSEIFSVEETTRLRARAYSHIVACARAPWRSRMDAGETAVREMLSAWKKEAARAKEVGEKHAAGGGPLSAEDLDELVSLFTDNSAGKVILGMDLDSTLGLLEVRFRTRAEREGTRAVVALRLYEIRHGSLPDGWEPLIEDEIIDAAPQDVFGGGPLKYSRERRVVWSVGPDCKDDGGTVESGRGAPAYRKDEVWEVVRDP